MSIRDLLSWVNFINTCSFSATHDDIEDKVLLPPALAYVHGACLVFLDALGSGSSSSASSSSSDVVKDAYQACFEFLSSQVQQGRGAEGSFREQIVITSDRTDVFGVSPFFIPRGMWDNSCFLLLYLRRTLLTIIWLLELRNKLLDKVF